MRKKDMKLKEELKKEILKEIELEKEKKQQIEKIVYKEPKVVNNTPEDLYSIRKNFLLVFLFSVGAAFLIFVFLFANPFDKPKKKVDKKEEEIKEEKVTTIEEELYNSKDGKVANNNPFVLQLFNLFDYNKEDYYSYDSTYIYTVSNLEITNIDTNYLMFLMTKTVDYKEMIGKYTKDLTGFEICEETGVIKIPYGEINEIISDNFNTTIVEHPEFIYNHYIDNSFSTTIKFIYSDDYYVSTCQPTSGSSLNNTKAQPIIKEAVKDGKYITITVKVPFIANGKVYSDFSLTNQISDSSSNDFLQYINDASEYNYIFIYDDNNYKLDKIVRIS